MLSRIFYSDAIRFLLQALVFMLVCSCQYGSDETQEISDGDSRTFQLPKEDGDSEVMAFAMKSPTLPIVPECLETEQGCIQLENWTCPEGWETVVHSTLKDTEGDPFSWCEPPTLAGLKVPEAGDQGSDYLTPPAEEEHDNADEICDASLGLMPELWGTRCQRIGDPCPEGDFPEIPEEVTGDRWFVKAGSSGGDGSSAKPFRTITKAIAASDVGDVIVLGEGVYEEFVAPSFGRTFWGACVERVTIHPPGDYVDLETAAVMVAGRIELRNLRITGNHIGIIIRRNNTELQLNGVFIDRVQRHGIYADPARAIEHFSDLVIENSLIFGVRPSVDGKFGRGIDIESNPTLSVRIQNSILEATHEIGWWIVGPGVTMEGSDILVRNIRPTPGGTGGEGINFHWGATAKIERILVEKNHTRGVYVAENSQADTSVEFDFLVIRDMLSQPASLRFGRGLVVADGAQVKLTHGLISNNRDTGVSAYKDKSTVILEDSVVQGTQAIDLGASIEEMGMGAYVSDGGIFNFTRTVLDGNHIAGLIAKGEGSIATLTDTAILNTETIKTDGYQHQGGWGIASQYADISADRLLVSGNSSLAVYQTHGGRCELSNALLVNTAADDTGLGGGLFVTKGSSCSLSQSVVKDDVGYGIYASQGLSTAAEEDPAITSLYLADVSVRNIHPAEGLDIGGMLGVGIVVIDGVEVTAERVLVEDCHYSGIDATHTGAVLSFTDLTVRNTSSIEGGEFAGQAGYGLSVSSGASLSVVRGLFTENRELGVAAMGSFTQLSLTDVEISGTLPRECADGREPERVDCYNDQGAPIPIGIGLGAFAGSEVTGRNVWVHSNHYLSGVRLSIYQGTPPEDWPSFAGTLSVANLRVENNLYGVHLLDLPPWYDFFSRNPGIYIFGNHTLDVSTQKGEDFSLVMMTLGDLLSGSSPF